MKRNRKNNIFKGLFGATLLLTTACAGVADLDMAQTEVNGSNTVTFTVQTQPQKGGMRALTTGNNTIGKGDKVDVLIFAVYVKDGDGNYTLDPSFQKKNPTDFKVGEGQNAINVNDLANTPVKIQLAIDDASKTYKVAFWAQSSLTNAYNTSDLTNVHVTYGDGDDKSNVKNNDELRDAFCAFSGEITSDTKNETVWLHRPFAQVNVGTAGWDYEGAACLRPSKTSYTESTITLNGVAQYYNVLDGKAVVDTDHQTVDATFDYAVLPAFIDVYDPTDKSWKETLTYEPFEDEEYLKVHVNHASGDYDPYVGWKEFDDYRTGDFEDQSTDYEGKYDGQNTKDKYEKGEYPETETYKYLSMSYVLVPEPTGGDGKSVLSSVEFTFRGIVGNDDEDTFDPKNGKTTNLDQTYTVNNVPVQKNWRTNILGNSFFTSAVKFHIDVVPDYMGDYNYNGDDEGREDPSTGVGWPGAENGEIHSVLFASPNDNNDCPGTDQNDNFFTCTGEHNHANKYKGIYRGAKYENGLKLEDHTAIEFTTKSPATVIIVQCDKADPEDNWTKDETYIMFDGVEQDRPKSLKDDYNKNVLVYTLVVKEGTHKITTSTSDRNKNNEPDKSGVRGRPKQPGIFYVEVRTSAVVDGDTENENKDYPDVDDDYYDK